MRRYIINDPLPVIGVHGFIVLFFYFAAWLNGASLSRITASLPIVLAIYVLVLLFYLGTYAEIIGSDLILRIALVFERKTHIDKITSIRKIATFRITSAWTAHINFRDEKGHPQYMGVGGMFGRPRNVLRLIDDLIKQNRKIEVDS
jgi:hypothetical protein